MTEAAASSEATPGTLPGLGPGLRGAFGHGIGALRALRNKGYGRSCARRTKRVKPGARHALDLKALGVGRDQLRKLAIANYRRLYRKLGVERLQPNIFLVVEGGELESSVMVDAVFWERARLSVSGELVAGAPARDIVLCSLWLMSLELESR